ncbi:MAG: protein kinase [Abditibacteriota bacterium]|nr:protein kinase [Abditibacteriota bacterium]
MSDTNEPKTVILGDNTAGDKAPKTVVPGDSPARAQDPKTVVLKDDGATRVLNGPDSAGAGDLTGTLLGGKYTVGRRMETSSGEADLYLCSDGSRTCVAKVFRRRAAIKDEVTRQILAIDSPYVARFLTAGTYNGFPFVVLPYYRNGSLAGKRFGLRELKELVIPSINEGLNALHKAGIFHKDLKPANIMLADDRKSVVIIDFGVSTVARDGVTTVNTQVNLTTEYSSIEALRGFFNELSDYYSLGICLYELYCGRLPFAGAMGDEISIINLLYQLPFPDNMEQELRDLITGLVWPDISTRNEPGRPNCRWGYEQVKNWLAGIPQPVPGRTVAAAEPDMPVYNFMGGEYTDIHLLMQAFAHNWEEGKKQLFRGYLSDYFAECSLQDRRTLCDDLMEGEGDEDMRFFECIYRLDPQMREFCWKDQRFADLKELGFKLFGELHSGRAGAGFGEILANGLVSVYLKHTAPGNGAAGRLAGDIEQLYRVAGEGSRNSVMAMYSMAFALTGSREYVHKDGSRFACPEDMTDYLEKAHSRSYEDFVKACLSFIDEKNELEPQLEAWLLALGKKNEVEAWKEQIKGGAA